MINSIGATIQKNSLLKSSDAYDIVLPNHTSHSPYIAIDIGGTLAKIAYYTPIDSQGKGGKLAFVKFQTDDQLGWFTFLKQLFEAYPYGYPILAATGGGAHLFYEELKKLVPKGKVLQMDEMDCLILGLDFLIHKIPYEVFTYQQDKEDPVRFIEKEDKVVYPYLLVNIGSGVSILLVTGPGKFQRVSGTSLGGGTFVGLVTLLTGERSFDDMLELSKVGKNSQVDMLVGDIYGTQYSKIGLKASAIASSMGKVYRKKLKGASITNTHNNDDNDDNDNDNDNSDCNEKSKFKDEDIIASLLYMVSNNIGQIAYLNALEHKVEHIYFGGYFIRGHSVTMNTLNYAIQFWSKGKMIPRFLRHEGYLGAMGGLLNLQDNLESEVNGQTQL